MKPEQKRVLVHATLTALVLATIGYFFAEFAGNWLNTQGARPGSADLNPALPEGARVRIPLLMALWGFAFVVVGEFVAARFHKRKPVEQPQPAAETEKLLNELLAKAEAERAANQPADPPPNPPVS
jgi:hypothetical protein